jgi:hypothetical protein
MQNPIRFEKIPRQVPPVDCVYRDNEEAVFRISVGSDHWNVCVHHMREYLAEVMEKLQD